MLKVRFSAFAIAFALAALVGCNSNNDSSNPSVGSSLSPLSSPGVQWMVGTWLQSSDGLGTEATPPAHRGRMQFQVNPPLFQWEGFRTVGVDSDPTHPLPSCRLREISQHFSFKPTSSTPSESGVARPGTPYTVTYFVDSLQLIPDPWNDSRCAGYLAWKQGQLSAMRQSYFFDVYQDSTGQIVDTLRQAAFARLIPSTTSDGCQAVDGVFADVDDTSTGRNYLWAQPSCAQVSVAENTWTAQYAQLDPASPSDSSNTNVIQSVAFTAGAPAICGQGGDGSCAVSPASQASVKLITHSDNVLSGIHTLSTEQVGVNSFGDLQITTTVQDDTGKAISSVGQVKFLQDPPPAQD